MGRAKTHLEELEYASGQILPLLKEKGVVSCCEIHDIYYTEQVYDDSLLEDYDFSEFTEDTEWLKDVLKHTMDNLGMECHCCASNAYRD